MFDSFRTMVDALLRSRSILTLVRTIEIEMRTSRMPPDSLFRMLGVGTEKMPPFFLFRMLGVGSIKDRYLTFLVAFNPNKHGPF